MRSLENNRIRGRKGVALRKMRLENEPLCRECAKNGRVTEAVVPDHIIPIAFGGTDSEDNIQCLCADCHAIKSAIEDSAHNGASNHPEWLRPSKVPIVIVCGPPCSGKTTYVNDNMSASDIVIDIDTIASTIDPDYRHWEGMLTADLLNKAVRVRNAMLGSLSSSPRAPAWFIVSAPSSDERTWWHTKLGGEVVLLDPGRTECVRRAKLRGTPNAVHGIDVWYRRASRPWYPPTKKVETGLDGWPVDKS